MIDTPTIEQTLADEHARRAAGGAPRMLALTTNEIALLRICVEIPLPTSVGIEGGMIVLAYEQTDANKAMARRVAVAMTKEPPRERT